MISLFSLASTLVILGFDACVGSEPIQVYTPAPKVMRPVRSVLVARSHERVAGVEFSHNSNLHSNLDPNLSAKLESDQDPFTLRAHLSSNSRATSVYVLPDLATADWISSHSAFDQRTGPRIGSRPCGGDLVAIGCTSERVAVVFDVGFGRKAVAVVVKLLPVLCPERRVVSVLVATGDPHGSGVIRGFAFQLQGSAPVPHYDLRGLGFLCRCGHHLTLGCSDFPSRPVSGSLGLTSPLYTLGIYPQADSLDFLAANNGIYQQGKDLGREKKSENNETTAAAWKDMQDVFPCATCSGDGRVKARVKSRLAEVSMHAAGTQARSVVVAADAEVWGRPAAFFVQHCPSGQCSALNRPARNQAVARPAAAQVPSRAIGSPTVFTERRFRVFRRGR